MHMFQIFHDEKDLEKVVGTSNLEAIRKRFSNYLKLTKTFIYEEKYIDKEWREEYSIAYSFTSYESITSLTSRLHLFSSEIKTMADLKGMDKDTLTWAILFLDQCPSIES